MLTLGDVVDQLGKAASAASMAATHSCSFKFGTCPSNAPVAGSDHLSAANPKTCAQDVLVTSNVAPEPALIHSPLMNALSLIKSFSFKLIPVMLLQ
jgi:hypothetical protein